MFGAFSLYKNLAIGLIVLGAISWVGIKWWQLDHKANVAEKSLAIEKQNVITLKANLATVEQVNKENQAAILSLQRDKEIADKLVSETRILSAKTNQVLEVAKTKIRKNPGADKLSSKILVDTIDAIQKSRNLVDSNIPQTPDNQQAKPVRRITPVQIP